MRILTVNSGSTSLKLERYVLGTGTLERALPPVPEEAVSTDRVGAHHALTLATRVPLDLVAHRIVRVPDDAPDIFALDSTAIARIRSIGAEAPLHDESALDVVTTIARMHPDLPQYAVSDSGFHRTLSAAAKTYALPLEQTRAGLHRIGYHGLSHQYAAFRTAQLAGLSIEGSRIVTVHLGGGSSLCAVRDGKSIDTTMGFTPLDGIPMATRSGSVDPGILIHLLRSGMHVNALEEMLERKSGLLGMSDRSGDVRELLAAQDDPAARLALDVLAWRVRASLGAMTAVLGGVDAIAFTGGIGEHAPQIRAAALQGGLGIGAHVDDARNAHATEGRIECHDAPVAIYVIPARENWQLAYAALNRERA